MFHFVFIVKLGDVYRESHVFAGSNPNHALLVICFLDVEIKDVDDSWLDILLKIDIELFRPCVDHI